MHLDRLLEATVVISCLSWNALSQSIPSRTNTSRLAFEPNMGQSAPGTSYIAQHRAYRISINPSSIRMTIPTLITNNGPVNARIVELRWGVGASESHFEPRGLLPGKSNYFVGNDPSGWVVDIPHYSELKESGLIPGVDLRYYSSPNGELEYDVILKPGTDLASVQFSVDGADQLRLDSEGALHIVVGGRELRQLVPRAYEKRGSRKVELKASYILAGNHVSFAVPGRTPGSQVVIDPVVVFATLLGAKDAMYHWNDEAGPVTFGFSTAVDPAGSFYIAGQTEAADFPVTKGAYPSHCPDTPTEGAACTYTPLAFVTKFSSSGELLYSTYLGGPTGLNPYYQPSGKVLAVDANGYAYLTGGAYADFPTTPGAYQRTCRSKGGSCAFLAKLNQNGSALAYSTLFGGSGGAPFEFNGGTFANGLALGKYGDVFMAGGTHDATLPTTPGAFQTACPTNIDGSCNSGFVARFNVNANGPASLVFSTYLGAAGGQAQAEAIALDRYDDAYVVGLSTVDMPSLKAFGTGTMPGYSACQPFGAVCSTFVSKLNGSNGQALRKATLLRGVTGTAIAVDSSLNSFIAGAATSGLATTFGAFQTKLGGGSTDAFIAKLDPSGYSLLFSTFLGGSADDVASDIAVNSNGMAFVTGLTNSLNFPLGPGAFTKTPRSSFLTAMKSDGTGLYYSSYLGAVGTAATGIALDPKWTAYVTGSGDFPTTTGALPITNVGFSDAFVAKVVIAADLRATVTISAPSVAKNSVVIYHARLTNQGPDGSDKLIFTDSIPPGMSYAGVYVPNGNGCTEPKIGATTGTLTCRKTRLEKGQTWYVNVYLRAVGSSGATIINKVKVTAWTQDLWDSNNGAAATVRIQ